jgi:tetratricopeptide (TPR) repeat protein
MKKIAVITILLFFVQLINFPLFAADESLKKGIEYFNDARFEQAIDILEKALTEDLQKEDKIQANLYIALAEIALNRNTEAKMRIKEITKIDPEFELKQDEYPQDVVNLFHDVQENFPQIYDFKAENSEFYPYRREQPSLSFKLSSAVEITIDMRTEYQSLVKSKRKFNSGRNTFVWDWNESFLNIRSLKIELRPEKSGAEGGLKKKINLNVEIPENLVYNGSEFLIPGRYFLPESKTVIRNSHTPYVIVWAAMGVGAGLLALNSEKTSSKVVWGLLGASCFSLVFSKKKREKEIGTESTGIKNLNSNINENNQLRNEINGLKEKIKVKQEILNEQE